LSGQLVRLDSQNPLKRNGCRKNEKKAMSLRRIALNVTMEGSGKILLGGHKRCCRGISHNAACRIYEMGCFIKSS
jgi:hypothetical protein